MEQALFILAVVFIVLAVCSAVVAVVIFVRMDVMDAIRFLQHKPMKNSTGKAKKQSHRRSYAKKSGGETEGIDSSTRNIDAGTGKVARKATTRDIDSPTQANGKRSFGLGARSDEDGSEDSELPTDLLDTAESSTSMLEEGKKELPDDPNSEQPTGLLEEESEQPTGLLEEESEQPTGLLEEDTEQPTGLLEEDSEQPTGLLEEESEQPTGLLEEESEQPTGLLEEESESDTQVLKVPSEEDSDPGEEESEQETGVLAAGDTGDNGVAQQANYPSGFMLKQNAVVVHTAEVIAR